MLRGKELNTFFRHIFEGSITPTNLGVKGRKLYRFTVKILKEGVNIGFSSYVDKSLKKELMENIYIFSGAKTYTQVKDISSLILDGGKLRPYNQFKKLAVEKYKLYNTDYLQAEYETAVGQAQTAVKWQQIESEAETFPYLKRSAVMDANTSPECVILNDIIAPVGSAFWATRSPLTHFRCRCILEQIDKYEDVKLSSQGKIDRAMKATDHINPLFKGNPGKDKVIFNDSHPYFDVAPKDRSAAKRNFDLPIK